LNLSCLHKTGIEDLVKTRRLLDRVPGKSSDPITLGCYEFGPGYALPSGPRPFIEEAELLGKSLALKMRNLYCSGDMMKVKNKAVKSVDIPDMMGYKRSKNDTYSERVIKGVSNIVMSSCYAFKDDDTYSFIVLNRNVKEARKTKITLPVDVAKKAKLYKLTGKPWDTNLTDINVKIKEEEIKNFSKNYTFNLTASSIYIFVVNKK